MAVFCDLSMRIVPSYRRQLDDAKTFRGPDYKSCALNLGSDTCFVWVHLVCFDLVRLIKLM